jgi:spermidine synthase
VTWFRALTLVFDHRASTFSSVVAVVLLGIAAGSFIVARLNRSPRDPARLLVRVQVGLALCGLAWLPAATWLSTTLGTLAEAVLGARRGPGAPFGVALLITTIPWVLMGMSFPLAVQVYAKRATAAGAGIGRMYALNLIGATIGSVATGFVLVPSLGVQQTLVGLSIVPLVAVGLLAAEDARGWVTPMTLATAGLAIGAMAFAPKTQLDSFFLSGRPTAAILESREDIEATVTVARHDAET